MVGLVDHNVQIDARIRVGHDFGTIRYMGNVSDKNKAEMSHHRLFE